jgi:hypothetical protein
MPWSGRFPGSVAWWMPRIRLPLGRELEPLVAWALVGWSVITGIGLLRLRRWARPSAIGLAFAGMTLFFPLGLMLSIGVLSYLFRADVARVFELGEGHVEVSEEEARRLARILRRASPPRA